MSDGLRSMLEEKLKLAGDTIGGALLEWGAAVTPEGSTLGVALESQIRFQAEKQGKTVQEVVDRLFETSDAETFLLRLQV